MLEWVEAPPEKKIGKQPKRPKYYSIARQLKANPGKWARILKDANTGTATLIKKGGYVSFRPEGDFEAVARTNGRKEQGSWTFSRSSRGSR